MSVCRCWIPELQLQAVPSCHVGAGNWIQDLWKIRQHAEPLIYLSSPNHFILINCYLKTPQSFYKEAAQTFIVSQVLSIAVLWEYLFSSLRVSLRVCIFMIYMLFLRFCYFNAREVELTYHYVEITLQALLQSQVPHDWLSTVNIIQTKMLSNWATLLAFPVSRI